MPAEAVQLLPGASAGTLAPVTPGSGAQPNTPAPTTPDSHMQCVQRPAIINFDSGSEDATHYPVNGVEGWHEPVLGPVSSSFLRHGLYVDQGVNKENHQPVIPPALSEGRHKLLVAHPLHMDSMVVLTAMAFMCLTWSPLHTDLMTMPAAMAIVCWHLDCMVMPTNTATGCLLN